MDFILSLTHFCEVHGPTSILCSQVAPTICAQCDSNDREFSPTDTPLSSNGGASPASGHNGKSGKQPKAAASLDCKSNSDLEPLSSPPSASAPTTATRLEEHPWFISGQYTKVDTAKFNCFGGAEGDTCASCRLTVPDDISKQLPPGAPGTMKENGQGRNGSPVLRSREMVYSCHDGISHAHAHSHAHHSNSTSARSSYSSDSSCHTHVVTYLSMRGPPNPTNYSILRRASIRTLSCEYLPRGLSSGPLSFGDPVTGYTIAYVFRLPDPAARGKRRSYALVALAGKDAGRAFRASPVIWRVFGRIAHNLVTSAERSEEREKRRGAGAAAVPNTTTAATATATAAAPVPASTRTVPQYTPISSFLTGRTLDPDGQRRRAGQVRARNLAEIVDNEFIFAEIHAQFVALLQQLGGMFGGSRIPENRLNPEAACDETEEHFPRPAPTANHHNHHFLRAAATTRTTTATAARAAAAAPSAPSALSTASRTSARAAAAAAAATARVRCDSPKSPVGAMQLTPKPIPISHRRHYAA
ncbi:hypothetical protein LOZ57_003489 [Ophidiomyces ophidiicola]|uniref:uncharacterized protein n=1 Tax=Ophidiomyces ophidiicola TaxID=1387563 RepID=UPI0020C52F21|nr:uncharacterized protein LOZ57_003489 [Ophidiomyces ophidiicola]KAI1946719.1 hypothetical protein LOZ57_003489 [Ophidiomyces ophidiicola]KAI2055548.1 hypothetical protein LOZ43_003695 [Ophidiomyces ophidiicola]